MALNVPMQEVQQPIVQSLSDAVGKWTDINRVQQGTELAKQQEARLQNQNERENKLGDLQFGEHQRKAHNEVMTEFKTVLQKKAQAAGIQPNTPEYQQLANATYATGFDKIMQNTGAPPYKMGTNIDLSAVDALTTAQDKRAMERQYNIEDSDDLQPNKLAIAREQAGIAQAQQERGFAQQERMKGYDYQHDDIVDSEKYQRDLELARVKANDPSKLEKIPPTHRMAYVENQTALNKIENAIKLVEANKDSFGLKNMLGENVNQRLDPDGVPARAAVAEIGGVKLHDLSGAAVSASESPRLMPLIPTATDDYKAIISKLNGLKAEYAGVNGQLESMYGNGEYKNPMKAKSQKTPPPKPDNISQEDYDDYIKTYFGGQ